MRRVSFGGRGRPALTTVDYEELVLVLQGAIQSVDGERFILERDELPVPTELVESARRHSYEVAVVGRFHTLAQRWLERQSLAGVWERAIKEPGTGAGRPPSIDVALFGDGVELRLEFGHFEITRPKKAPKSVDPKKLKEDAAKLNRYVGETSPVIGVKVAANVIFLWHISHEKNTAENLRWYVRSLTAAAAAASSGQPFDVDHLLTSSMDLIAAKTNQHRVVYVGLFEVNPRREAGADSQAE